MEYSLSSSFNITNRQVNHHRRLNITLPKRCRPRVVVPCASSYGGFISSGDSNSSYCKFSGLNTPIVPVTTAGRFLLTVLLDERNMFHDAVAETLEKLVFDVDEAYARIALTADSSEAVLHRRIAELKAQECKTSVEDVMYMLILYKFSELKVHLVPPLSKCIYNNRLEILPSKDYELESIHTFEINEMIKAYLTLVIKWRPDFSVTENWATTNIKHADLYQIYTTSILFGYFLKSTALRHRLEMSLVDPIENMIMNSSYICRRKNLLLGHSHNKKLVSYLTRFTPDSLMKCAQPNSKEALSLITKHSFALFGDVGSEKVISTSFATLKRLALEAIAFGSFLWDAEEYVKTVYNLEEVN